MAEKAVDPQKFVDALLGVIRRHALLSLAWDKMMPAHVLKVQKELRTAFAELIPDKVESEKKPVVKKKKKVAKKVTKKPIWSK